MRLLLPSLILLSGLVIYGGVVLWQQKKEKNHARVTATRGSHHRADRAVGRAGIERTR